MNNFERATITNLKLNLICGSAAKKCEINPCDRQFAAVRILTDAGRVYLMPVVNLEVTNCYRS